MLIDPKHRYSPATGFRFAGLLAALLFSFLTATFISLTYGGLIYLAPERYQQLTSGPHPIISGHSKLQSIMYISLFSAAVYLPILTLQLCHQYAHKYAFARPAGFALRIALPFLLLAYLCTWIGWTLPQTGFAFPSYADLLTLLTKHYPLAPASWTTLAFHAATTLLEACFFLVIPIILFKRKEDQALGPFYCDTCADWRDVTCTFIARLPDSDSFPAIESGDLTPLLAPGTSDCQVRLTLCRCPNCTNLNVISIDQRLNRFSPRRPPILNQALINRSHIDALIAHFTDLREKHLAAIRAQKPIQTEPATSTSPKPRNKRRFLGIRY